MTLFTLIIVVILNLLVVLATLVFIVWLVQSMLLKAPFLPLPHLVVAKVVEMAMLVPENRFYDLGSGDGRVVRVAARRYPAATCVGVEKAILPSLLAWYHEVFKRNSNALYLRQDFRQVKLESANVLFLYLWPSVMAELAPKLKAELLPTTRIITCQFELAGFKLDTTESVAVAGQVFKLYVYTNNL